MADFHALEALINAYIKQNGVQAITGQILNGVLRGMVSALGKGWTVAGQADPSTDPGTMTGPVAYIAHEAGTYTHFGGLVVDDGEVAFLKYNEQVWTKEVLASLAATASVDGNVGTPSVDTQFVNGVLTFAFHNMKGTPGEDGAAAGFGTVNATVDGNVGTPGVSVQSSGPDTAKNFTFQFTNLKGDTGVTSVVVTVDNTSGTPACTASLSGGVLTLAFTGLKGAQGNPGSSLDYPFTLVNNLTTNDPDQALTAAMGYQLEGEIAQLEHKQYSFYNLIWDNIGASAFWGEKPDIHFDENSVPVNITLAEGLSITNPSPVAELGEAYTTRITPNKDYRIASIRCYMGGVEQTVLDGLIEIEEVTSGIVINTTAEGLDDIATDGKTYRDIFETNNILAIPPGYDNGTFGTGMEISNGSPALTDQVYCTPGYSLHLPLGSPIAQTRTTSTVVSTNKKTFVAMMVRVDTAGGTGGIGFQIGTQKSAKKTTSTGFVRWATKITTGPSQASRVFLGVLDGSDIEGYVDSPVVVLESYFTSIPSVDDWVALYEKYIEMKNH